VTGKLLENLPDARQAEITQILATGHDVRIERIVSHGQASPDGFWYRQDEHEWVALLSGAAELEFRNPDDRLSLVPGDHVLIPAGREHRVDSTRADAPSVWLAVFFRN